MHYVYLIRSESTPDQIYTGLTDDLRQRLTDHNAGKSTHTAKHRPWTLETYLAFSDPQQARDFERYLKTASGIAFARKRLRRLPSRPTQYPPSRRIRQNAIPRERGLQPAAPRPLTHPSHLNPRPPGRTHPPALGLL